VPFTVRFESPTDEYLEVRLWGSVTQAEFDAMAEAARPHLREWLRVLVDASDLENAPEVLTMLLRAPCRAQIPHGVRQAAVVGPRAAAVARAWVRVVSPGSGGAQAFSSREPALEWLLLEYQTTTGGS
jgi:hypothetical protein